MASLRSAAACANFDRMFDGGEAGMIYLLITEQQEILLTR